MSDIFELITNNNLVTQSRVTEIKQGKAYSDVE